MIAALAAAELEAEGKEAAPGAGEERLE